MVQYGIKPQQIRGTVLPTFARCRVLLGAEARTLSEKAIRDIRDQLHRLAQVAVTLSSGAAQKPSPEFQSSLLALDLVDRTDAEERAAIIEYDAGMTREQAERLALEPVRRRRRTGRPAA